jgi:ribosomal protein S18 acetylase RimI-like enzyme
LEEQISIVTSSHAPHKSGEPGAKLSQSPRWSRSSSAPRQNKQPMKHGSCEIEAYRASDQEHVVSLWEDVFRDDPPANAPLGMIARKLTVQPELFLVARVAGQLVGTVLAGFDGVRGWIHHLAVAPRYRRRGVASALMTAAERGLLALGCPKVNLQVRATNAEVVAFYRSLGYVVEERLSLGKRISG